MTTNFAIEQFEHGVMAEIQAALAVRLDRAAERLRRQIAANIDQPGKSKGGKQSGPQEFPRRNRGELGDRLFVDAPAPLLRRVLTDQTYGLFLELGTRDMQPRPFLTRTLTESATELAAIVAEGSAA